MTLKYRDRPYGPQQSVDPFSRFPVHSQPIQSAPAMGSRPIRVFSADGRSAWAIHHGDSWRVVATVPDADGNRRVRMTGEIVRCPVRWSSS
jgi:hypothetical protein